MPSHSYRTTISWRGETRDYDGYTRDYDIAVPGKAPARGSADAAFKGDPRLYNPEDLLLISLAACHMLSYLAVCARSGIVVLAYEDHAQGTMAMRDRRMRFTEVTLRPDVRVAPGTDLARARAAHEEAHDQCFIASSVNFPVRHEASVR